MSINSKLYDMMLRSGNRINCIAADDNHNYHSLDSVYSDLFGGFVMIKAEDLNIAKLLMRLKRVSFICLQTPKSWLYI